MDDNGQKSSWDDLIQDLGAQPDESAFERKQPPPQEIPPSVEWSEADEVPEPEQATSDWGGLAETLGIEVEDEPEAEVAEAAAEQVAEDEPILEEHGFEEIAAEKTQDSAADYSDAEAISEAGEADSFGGSLAPPEESPTDEAAEVDSTDELPESDELPPLPSKMDQAMSETAWDDDSEQSGADSDEDVDGISGEAARSAFDALFADGSSSWGSAFLDKPKRDSVPSADKSRFDDDDLGNRADDLDAAPSDAAPSDNEADASDETGEEDEERPKRKRSRRRRRGGRGRKPADQDAVQETEGEAQADSSEETSEDGETKKPKRRRRRRSRSSEKTGETAEKSELAADDDLEEALIGGDGDEEENPRRGRQRHRNIPAWSEAIGMIVDANLEQRAKNPSKPQSSRGGRGRGGRRRGGRKPEGK